MVPLFPKTVHVMSPERENVQISQFAWGIGTPIASPICLEHCTTGSVPLDFLFFSQRRHAMLSWALSFLIIALIAGALGLWGLEGMAMQVAWILFVVFLILFLVSLVTGRRTPIS
jgi:uncharacterized membrane protein YtjA (UPF0391 family)